MTPQDRRVPGGPELIDWIVQSVQSHAWEMAWATVGVVTERARRELVSRKLPSRPLVREDAVEAAKYRVCMFDPDVSHYDLRVREVESHLSSKDKATKVVLETKQGLRYIVMVAQKESRIEARIDQVIKTS